MAHSLQLKYLKEPAKNNIIHERIPVKIPNMNAHIETFHSILEAECYPIHEFAYREIVTFIRLYNERKKTQKFRIQISNAILPKAKE